MKLSPKLFLRFIPFAMVAACTMALLAWQWPRFETAPDVGYVLLDGTQSSSASFKGKVTLVNFWATSCAVCVTEMPKLTATHQKFKERGFEMLAVAMQYDPPSYVVNYAETRKLPFAVAIDNTGAVARAWGGVNATPTTFLVGPDGRIVKRYIGEPDFAELDRLIDGLLRNNT